MQNPVKPVKWIVPLKRNGGKTAIGRQELKAACRGREAIGVLLNYFIYEASFECTYKQQVDLSKVEFVRLNRTEKEILAGINDGISVKTLISYIRKLSEWGFIQADGYRHRYDVYFKEITAAMSEPPAPEKRKPRGRHVKKLNQLNRLNSSNSRQVKEVKTTNSPINEAASEANPPPDGFVSLSEFEALKAEFVNLQSEFVKLQTQMVNLQSEFVILQTRQSSEEAPGAVSSGDSAPIDPIRSLRSNRDLRKNGTAALAPPATSKSSSKKSNSQKGKTPPEAIQESLPEPKAEITMTDGARYFWEKVWSKTWWCRNSPPKLTATAAQHCEDMKDWGLDVAEVEAIQRFYKKKYPDRAFELGNLAHWTPKYRSQAQPPSQSSTSAEAPPPASAGGPEHLVLWVREGLEAEEFLKFLDMPRNTPEEYRAWQRAGYALSWEWMTENEAASCPIPWDFTRELSGYDSQDLYNGHQRLLAQSSQVSVV